MWDRCCSEGCLGFIWVGRATLGSNLSVTWDNLLLGPSISPSVLNRDAPRHPWAPACVLCPLDAGPLHLKTTNPAANTLEPKIHLTDVFEGHWRKGFHSTPWIQQTALSSCPRAFSLLLPPPSCCLSKQQLFPPIVLSIVASLLACRPNSKNQSSPPTPQS